MFCLYGERKMAKNVSKKYFRLRQEGSCGIQTEAILDTFGPRFEGLHHHSISELSKRTFDEGVMVRWCSGWCGGVSVLQTCGECVAWTLSEPPSPPRHCMGVISKCSERRREGVYVAGVQLYAAVLNEAMSEHGENMRVLATSKTSEVFWLCFPVVWRLMGAPCGCGSNSCKQPVWSKITPQVEKGIYYMDLKDNTAF